jgi:hypothetical protein
MTDRLKAIVGCAFLGCVIAGVLGHHEDNVQWMAIVAGSWIGGLTR